MKQFITRLAAPLHLSPEFIIIGAQKAGTTSLYDYLVQHPCIGAASTKEVHFFDHHFGRGPGWYARRFPTVLDRQRAGKPLGHELITGEASPYYLFHPHAPRRVRAMLPQAKLIVLLRNPVDRAYSHYQHNLTKKTMRDPQTGNTFVREPLSFEEALKAEDERLEGELAKMLADENYRSLKHQLYSYKARGVYADQLSAWLEYFPREQFLILGSEKFARETPEVFGRVLEFLGLPSWTPAEFKRQNAGSYAARLQPETRQELVEYFRPHNARLYQLLGEEFDWDQ